MSDLTVANTILKQMGGTGRLVAMIGANSFLGTDNEVTFRWKCKAKNGANTLRVTLLPNDTYEMNFGRIRSGRFKLVARLKPVYAEDLIRRFEETTGLYLRAIPVSRVNQ